MKLPILEWIFPSQPTQNDPPEVCPEVYFHHASEPYQIDQDNHQTFSSEGISGALLANQHSEALEIHHLVWPKEFM